MLLADLGADVIKVEAPEGDPIRVQGAGRDGLSWYFAAFNRNKRSITLNLKSVEGRELLEKLISSSHALVENYRPGVLDRLGFPVNRLQELRPGLVSCSISGFGGSGPYRNRPAFDFIAQAMSGFMSATGTGDGPPLRTGIPISDLVAGLYGALAISSSLLRQTRTGEGEHIEVSLTSSMISLLAYVASNYFATGRVAARTGNDHPIAAPYGMFRTSDGIIAIAPSDNTFFIRLIAVLGLDDLANDPRFEDNPHRVQHRHYLNERVQAKLNENTSAHWIEALNAAGVPCGPIYDVANVFDDPQVKSQEMSIEFEQPGYGTIRTTGFPIKMANTPSTVWRHVPGLGEHQAEIVEELLRNAAVDQADAIRLQDRK